MTDLTQEECRQIIERAQRKLDEFRAREARFQYKQAQFDAMMKLAVDHIVLMQSQVFWQIFAGVGMTATVFTEP